MKLFAWILVLLLALSVALAAPVIAWRTHPGRDCANEVLTVKGPHGEEIECVCLGGTLSACFTPEP
jgi:hypothetical protein